LAERREEGEKERKETIKKAKNKLSSSKKAKQEKQAA